MRFLRHSESRHSWSLQGIVLDIATTRRLALTLTLTLYRIPNRKLSLLEMAENGGPSEWRADTVSVTSYYIQQCHVFAC